MGSQKVGHDRATELNCVRLQLDTDSWWQTKQTKVLALRTLDERKVQQAVRVSPAWWDLGGLGRKFCCRVFTALEGNLEEGWGWQGESRGPHPSRWGAPICQDLERQHSSFKEL